LNQGTRGAPSVLWWEKRIHSVKLACFQKEDPLCGKVRGEGASASERGVQHRGDMVERCSSSELLCVGKFTLMYFLWEGDS